MNAPLTFALTLLTSLGLAQAQGAKEAQALFEAMEAKLTRAKSLHVTSTSLAREGDFYVIFNGKAWLGEGGKFKMTIDAPIGPDGAPVDVEVVCDGTSVSLNELTQGEPRTTVSKAPAQIGSTLRRCASRLSVFAGYMLIESQLGEGASKEPLPLKAFKLGPKERDGGRAFQVIEYQTESAKKWFGRYGGPDQPVQVKLWIDTATGLPHKRTVTLPDGPRLEESYGAFTLDPELPEDTFTLTGEAPAKPKPAAKPKPKPAAKPKPTPKTKPKWF